MCLTHKELNEKSNVSASRSQKSDIQFVARSCILIECELFQWSMVGFSLAAVRSDLVGGKSFLPHKKPFLRTIIFVNAPNLN